MLKAHPNQPGQLIDLLKKVPLLNHLSIRLPPGIDLQAIAFSRGCCPVLVPNLQSCYFCTVMEDIPPETIEGLNLLASSQCDITGTGQAPLDHRIGHRQLETLLVYLPNYSSSERCRHNLQGWANSTISNALKSGNHRLTMEIPELFHGAISRRRKYDFMWKDRVVNILRNIENIHVENASDIVVCYSTSLSFFLFSTSSNKYTSLISLRLFSLSFILLFLDVRHTPDDIPIKLLVPRRRLSLSLLQTGQSYTREMGPGV